MAVIGLGYKDWATSDSPTADEVDGYWQRQVVMHFATTAARDLAITAPGEGMQCYIAANKSRYFYDGSAWVFREGWGAGSPEGAVTATKGALWHRTDGGAGEVLYIKESDTTNTGWVAVGSSGTSVPNARLVRTAGNINVNSTSWADLSSATDLTLAGVVAGDVVEITPSIHLDSSAVEVYWDVVTIVSAAAVNTVGGGTFGVPGWWCAASVTASVVGGYPYVVQSGDLSAGSLTLRLRYKTSTATTRVVWASDPKLAWSVKNLGQ